MEFDWKQLAGPLVSVGGTILGGVIGGPAGAALGPMIGQALAGALGCAVSPDAIGAALQLPGAANTVAQAQAQIGPAVLSAQDAYLADLQNARAQTVDLAKAGSSIAWSAPVISLVIVIGFLGLVAALLFKTVPDSQVVMVLFGALAQSFGQVCNYWLGSSKGSADKTDALAAFARKAGK